MLTEVTLVYSQALVRRAVFLYWRRTLGVGFFVALLVVATGLGFLIAQGKAGWGVGALATVLLGGVLLILALYVVRYRSAISRFDQLDSHAATFSANETTFTMRSRIGTTTLEWAVVKELWQFSDVWLLMYSKAQFNLLPVACMSPELRAFVRQRVQAAGGQVDG